MQIAETTFNHLKNRKNTPTIVAFGATWSGKTEMLFSILNRLEKEFKDNVNFCQFDIEKNPDFANQWGINEVPTTLILYNNEVVDHFVGLMSRTNIRQKINAYL